VLTREECNAAAYAIWLALAFWADHRSTADAA